MNYDDICQSFVGKEKIQPLNIIKQTDGSYRLHYREGTKNRNIKCEDRRLLDQILVEFGGKNPETCKTQSRFLRFDGSWGADILHDLGHIITKINIIGGRTIKSNKYPLYPPAVCGQQGTIESAKKGRDVIYFHQQELERVVFTRSFRKTSEFDSLIKWVFGESVLKKLTWTVQKLCTESIDVKKQCVWKRTMAGDGTKRMVLELTHLDGVHYEKCVRQDLFDAAGDMFDAPCKVIKMKKMNEPTKKVCILSAEDGTQNIDGFEAAS